ncbi:hypothetical protein B0H19DRAFT_1063028 [Mycena capillaripes]|nr:hypothetical protein B0H19DRAFT_1063028 [Mycena capillaripes]
MDSLPKPMLVNANRWSEGGLMDSQGTLAHTNLSRDGQMDQQGLAHMSAYASAYWDLADLCLWGGLNAVTPRIHKATEKKSNVVYGTERFIDDGLHQYIIWCKNPTLRMLRPKHGRILRQSGVKMTSCPAAHISGWLCYIHPHSPKFSAQAPDYFTRSGAHQITLCPRQTLSIGAIIFCQNSVAVVLQVPTNVDLNVNEIKNTIFHPLNFLLEVNREQMCL